MGKQKIDRLLAQLKENHQQDIQNSAAIYTVAQGAVNELRSRENVALPEASPQVNPLKLTKADLIAQYGNYNACRREAKKKGIHFSRSPRWSQIVAAFNYIEACQQCVDSYIAQHPNADLKGIKITVSL